MKKNYKVKEINKTKLKSYLDKKPKKQTMKEIQDSVQVGLANGSAIGLSLVEANEVLTFISLSLAIAFTIYKFFLYEKKKTK